MGVDNLQGIDWYVAANNTWQGIITGRQDGHGHDNSWLLAQQMGQFRANILLIPTASIYLWASEVLEINYFYLPREKNTQNWNHGLISIKSCHTSIGFFIIKIKNLRQFSEKIFLQKWALNCIVWFKNNFLNRKTTKFSLFIGWMQRKMKIIDF